MGLWFLIVAVWVAYAATGAAHGVSVPWLVTIGCWASVDLVWRRLARGNAPAGDGRVLPLRSRVLTMIPYLLYCLPLGNVPILGVRLLPPSSPIRWAGAAMCVAGVGCAIHARRILAKNCGGPLHLGVSPAPGRLNGPTLSTYGQRCLDMLRLPRVRTPPDSPQGGRALSEVRAGLSVHRNEDSRSPQARRAGVARTARESGRSSDSSG
jgi:hypothetical protein